MPKTFIHKSSILMIILTSCLVISLFTIRISIIPVFVTLLFVMFSIYFFRGWEMPSSFVVDDHILYSPCDGIIKKIEETSNQFHIIIFLNIHNIHVQYAPFNCKIKNMKYIEGSFRPAYILEKSQYNERQHYTLSNNIFGDIQLIQIAGQVARRIQPFVNKGENVKALAPLGMIKFGSRCDLVINKKTIKDQTIVILKNVGDRVHIGDKLCSMKKI